MKISYKNSKKSFVILVLKLIILSFIHFTININDTYAQDLFQNGYIITNQNDTINGQIKYEDWIHSPRQIDFKKSDGTLKSFSAAAIRGFSLDADQIIFKSKKIGLLNIALRESYRSTPSLDSKDSVQIFLKELVSGEHASLYLYLNAIEEPHYFLETDKGLQELYYYIYYKVIENKRYLSVLDKYKEQLLDVTNNSPEFHEPIPLYQEKYLKTYIEKYNRSFPAQNATRHSENEKYIFDLDVNAGMENWNNAPITFKNKPTFGFGGRVSFPGKFHNRFVKVNFFLTPAVHVGYDSASSRKANLKLYEVAFGSYLGTRNLKPYIGFQYCVGSGDYGSDFVGFQAGISYKKRLDLEIGHFANFISPITQNSFFVRPRISVHYFITLSSRRERHNPAFITQSPSQSPPHPQTDKHASQHHPQALAQSGP